MPGGLLIEALQLLEGGTMVAIPITQLCDQLSELLGQGRGFAQIVRLLLGACGGITLTLLLCL